MLEHVQCVIVHIRTQISLKLYCLNKITESSKWKTRVNKVYVSSVLHRLILYLNSLRRSREGMN